MHCPNSVLICHSHYTDIVSVTPSLPLHNHCSVTFHFHYTTTALEYATLVVTILGEVLVDFECYHFTLIYFRLATTLFAHCN